ncbi:hypothetical protein [Celeribacter baekdonensis]|uniref:hypothetical protein n=1 Tax=Celeribacter baekdonensis TaxID=875171 RepID=UPI00094272D5|nr:hypothetical protein [Celeribacter baekdonensis]
MAILLARFGGHILRYIISILSAAFVFGTGLTAEAQVVQYETEGNLAATHKMTCVGFAEAGPDLSPADLALGARDCFRKKRGEDMAGLFLLLKVRGYFDTKRVKDRTAHQAVTVIAMNLESKLGQRYARMLQDELAAFFVDGSSKKIEFCTSLRASPPPSYIPSYMIQHGMDVVLGKPGTGLVDGFSAKAAWRDVIETYVKCP